ncbi:hypothetical protein BB8028_0008g01260 [Beauveria bassiana]|uniref:Uncharacterized protein n=1 Tax=Beauveria bassiana TaxID=176275 RepID=A0A2S7YNI4_BEABA|nr:hypothetical protein BB8028_0008g01260 [Beauveria bassiana]
MSGINTLELQRLYDEAQIRPEWATTKFWEYVFKQIVFNDPMWSVASQQPPTRQDGDLRMVDLVAEYILENFTLLFVEAKRSDACATLICEVEYQAFTACCAHLVSTQRKTGIWAMTCVGTKVRLWAYQSKDDYLTPFWPLGDELGAKNEYVDFSTHGQVLLEKLDYIKNHPVPGEQNFEQSPQPRPTEVTLPSDWHDQEAKLIFLVNAEPPNPILSPPVVPGHEPNIIREDLCREVFVKLFWQDVYMCIKSYDEDPIFVHENDWVQGWIGGVQGPRKSYIYIDANTGEIYYTWSLETDSR